MIQLQEMANFMYDNIISQMQWQQKKAIIERKASRPRTAPPAGFLVADTYPSTNYARKFLKMFQPLHNKLARLREAVPRFGEAKTRRLFRIVQTIPCPRFIFTSITSIISIHIRDRHAALLNLNQRRFFDAPNDIPTRDNRQPTNYQTQDKNYQKR